MYQYKPSLGCNDTFLIDLTPNETLFGDKSIVKVKLQTKFGLIIQFNKIEEEISVFGRE